MSIALVLSGGGARAAYQVGVLNAVSELLGTPDANPFPIICGTSAGAINASLLACESDHFGDAVHLLDSLWRGLDSEDVHELGVYAVLESVFTLLVSFLRGGYQKDEPWSLLENDPLRDLLGRVVRFERLAERINQGDLEALTITALGYSSGASLSFYEASPDHRPWRRHRRIGVPTALGLDHLMASAAIPGIYPAVKIHREYFGDGAIRQSAPLSPALHLGARKLFVVGVSHNPDESVDARFRAEHTPSVAQMTSQFFNRSFIDALEDDMERLLRINRIVNKLNDAERAELNLYKVDVMSISPSRPFDEIAAAHIDALPRSMRLLFRTLGATRSGGGASLASYLLFEAPFISELIDCGYVDAMMQGDEIRTFLAAES